MKIMLNVLMLGWEFPPHISGGLGTACHGLVKGLRALGNSKVSFVMPRLSGEEDGKLARFFATEVADIRLAGGFKAGIPVLPWNIKSGDASNPAESEMSQFLHLLMEPKEYDTYLSGLDGSALSKVTGGDPVREKFLRAYLRQLVSPALSYAKKMESVLHEIGDFDVIHAHDWFTYIAGVRVKRMTGKPLVLHVHSTEIDRSENVVIANKDMGGSIYAIERFGMEKADRIIAVSNYTRSVLVKYYGIETAKIDVVHNASEPFSSSPDRLAPSDESPTVAYIGRVTYQKGPSRFVEAAAKVLERFPDARFVLAGTGDQIKSVKSQVAALGLEKNVSFPGFLDGEQISKLLAESDVYVMPSISEPFGIGALEALHAGVPIIISERSGVAEILTEAICVNPFDANSIADAITGVLEQPGPARAQVEKLRQQARQLHWNTSAQRVFDVYRSAIHTAG